MTKTTLVLAAGLLVASFATPAAAQQGQPWFAAQAAWAPGVVGFSYQLPRYHVGGYGHSLPYYYGPYGYGRTARVALMQDYAIYGYGPY
ncbi:MAG: hypothetical protein AB7I42_03180 [Bradyrhizobium sp.]|uniref:hypothetical protein n=1 Tax=Bradyrhizobium sp. TaxID=376 RepID=UPI00354847D0